MKSDEISSSLFAATDAAGLPDNVATQSPMLLAATSISAATCAAATNSPWFTKCSITMANRCKSGRLLAAEFVNQGKSYRAFWFQNAEGKGGYYAPDGNNLKKAFLRSPLAFSRISSGFAMRFHPFLHQWRAHKASITPLRPALASKRPLMAPLRSSAGSAATAMSSYSITSVTSFTRYAHLVPLRPRPRKGMRVHPGRGDRLCRPDRLGDRTASALRISRQQQVRDPLQVALPGGLPFPPQQLAAFNSVSSPLAADLNLLSNTNLALSE